ncbi:hypothetical protein KEM55_004243 [Ascosphaera atra]|nr:hypothetical protein KEM55_004243 [Ascosphaera atra]
MCQKLVIHHTCGHVRWGPLCRCGFKYVCIPQLTTYTPVYMVDCCSDCRPSVGLSLADVNLDVKALQGQAQVKGKKALKSRNGQMGPTTRQRNVKAKTKATLGQKQVQMCCEDGMEDVVDVKLEGREALASSARA